MQPGCDGVLRGVPDRAFDNVRHPPVVLTLYITAQTDKLQNHAIEEPAPLRSGPPPLVSSVHLLRYFG
jgi:hypothetical protein